MATLSMSTSPQTWSTAVAAVPPDEFDPVDDLPFTLLPTDPVATAGTCFAQFLGPHLRQAGYNFLQAEPPVSPGEPGYSARYGNITTTRQLRQLMLGAYGLHRPATHAWRRNDGSYIDPLRPQIVPAGFATAGEVATSRSAHLAAVRRVFQDCRVFVFTLGSADCWFAPDGTALPLPPAVVGAESHMGDARFATLSASEMRQDLTEFVADLSAVNPAVRVILTVSPVPPAVSWQPRHILIAAHSGLAAMQVSAAETAAAYGNVAYFPSFDILTAPQLRARFLAADFRTVTEEGMAFVLGLFTKHVMRAPGERDAATAPDEAGILGSNDIAALMRVEDSRHTPHDIPGGEGAAAPPADDTTTADMLHSDSISTGTLPVEIEFRTGGHGHEFMIEGWSHPEIEYAWTLGKRSFVRLPGGGANCDCSLKFRAGPMIHHGTVSFQRLYVDVNGVNVANLVGRQPAQYEVLVPAEALRGHAHIDITFRMPDAVSPSRFGRSGDKRELGFWLSTLRLEPLLAGPIFARPTQAASAGQDMTDTKAVMMQMQSLGINCELGFVQRYHEAEPLGLFRWAHTPLPNLLRALEARFEGLGDPANTIIRVDAATEFQVIDKKFGFRNHSFAFKKDGATEEKVRERELVRLPFLSRLMIDDLQKAEKLFCFHDAGHSGLEDILRLTAALDKYGPNWLLWICGAGGAAKLGTAERISDRLICGYIDKFQPLHDVAQPSIAAWTEAVRAGYRVWRGAK